MSVPGPAEGFVVRLDDVSTRLGALAGAGPPDAVTTPDPDTGERWEAAQVWSHIVEFIPYWREQIDRILGADAAEAVPFGRVKTDPDRLARIEQGRSVPLNELWDGTREELGHLKGFLTDLSDEDWRRHGLHPTLGDMDMQRIVERFLVGHLEEHAEQLESLTDPPTPPTG
jgi:alkanesulfonate monooxygenase SsuD/methylene tetrahydromethanopterin reductase-like flavin-dependent oxidoreductase (luciferase family)